MDWEEACDEARINLGLSPYGWVGEDNWNDIVEEAKDILREERSRIATWEHKEYLNSPEWKDKREAILKRDNYLCQDCLKLIPEIFLLFNQIEFEKFEYNIKADDVHHLDYKYKQTKEEEKYCISLCKLHHELRHCFIRDGIIWIRKEIENNILIGIYHKILLQPKYIQESQEQHLNFIESLKIKPKI
jgi:hypothetical protein